MSENRFTWDKGDIQMLATPEYVASLCQQFLTGHGFDGSDVHQYGDDSAFFVEREGKRFRVRVDEVEQ